MMKVLKDYVCSMAWLEGSMAKGYVLEESLGFVIEYLHEFEHVSRKVWDAEEEKGFSREVLEGVFTKVVFNPILQDLAHKYYGSMDTMITLLTLLLSCKWKC